MKAGRRADPGLARRHRRRGGARRAACAAAISAAPPSTSIRPSRRPPDNPLLKLDRRGRVAAAADAAHRRRHAPVVGIPVPLGVAERRARADARRSRRSTACIELLHSRHVRALSPPALQRSTSSCNLPGELLRRAGDDVEAERLDPRLHLRRVQDGEDLVVELLHDRRDRDRRARAAPPSCRPRSRADRIRSWSAGPASAPNAFVSAIAIGRARVRTSRRQPRARWRTAPAPDRPSDRSAPGSCPCSAHAPCRSRLCS